MKDYYLKDDTGTNFCQNGPLCDIDLALIDSFGSWSAIEIVEIGFAIVEIGGTEFTTAEFTTAELATVEFTVVEFWTEFSVAEFGSNELADVVCVGSSEFVFT